MVIGGEGDQKVVVRWGDGCARAVKVEREQRDFASESGGGVRASTPFAKEKRV